MFLRRTFLILAALLVGTPAEAARDDDAPFFTKAQVRRIWDASLAYLL